MNKSFFFVGVLAVAGAQASAHDGRRLEIQVDGNKIVAQGYLSGANPTDDGAGIVRPYRNVIHSHWVNSPVPGSTNASASLPGFDIFAGSPLEGFAVDLELVGASKWDSPPITGAAGTIPEGTVPVLTALGAGEEIFVGYGGSFVSTGSAGGFDFVDSVSPSGNFDLDLSYDIGILPEGALYVLDFVLSTDAPGIESSDLVHIVLAPDGVGTAQRLHFASLALEEFLGTPVPAPGAVSVFAFAGFAMARRRRAS